MNINLFNDIVCFLYQNIYNDSTSYDTSSSCKGGTEDNILGHFFGHKTHQHQWYL